MPRHTELSDAARHRLARIIDEELLGGAEPSITLHDLADEGELLNSSEFMVPYLNVELEARDSRYRVEQVERYYFDFSPYGPVLGAICYLGLIDPTAQTRRLFTLGGYKPGVTWMPEQNSGAQFEQDRQFLVGSHRQV